MYIYIFGIDYHEILFFFIYNFFKNQTQMSAQKSCMASTPSFLNFQTKVSFILWAEYNLIVAVDALRGFTDLSALFSIFAVTTLLAIKMR